jgi:predicted thioesterase
MPHDDGGDELSSELTPGARGEVSLEVGESDTAIAHASGDVPVLATPRLVALCEEATVLAIAGSLDPSFTSVGTHVEIDHLAASRVGESVTARAELVEVEGRRLTFEVTVMDAAGELVARSRIRRAVVDRTRFLG